MTKGEGLVGLLYAIRDILEASAVWILTSAGVLIFFWVVVRFIMQKMGKDVFGPKVTPGQLLFAVFLLFVIFGLYSLIALTGAIFGVNSSPSGGLYLQ
jgi:hypothetical protein